ncbi:hypothetical protein T12_4667 [Trichinella patagoniensis]|uniref:Uncharacterized protein n=1 Tax=Trichinella patagoniensis TaxID=990121 RepID=A0A0V0Z6Z2_9BILA|nr:hypothetical protein T12_4667 [Trichinella patagoniensis]
MTTAVKVPDTFFLEDKVTESSSNKNKNLNLKHGWVHRPPCKEAKALNLPVNEPVLMKKAEAFAIE